MAAISLLTVPDAVEPPADPEIMRQLQERIDQRVRSGLYPAELEDDLAAHFAQAAARLGPREGARAVLLAALERAGDFRIDRIPYISSVPLGTRLHRAIGVVVRRQVIGIFAQMREYHRALRDVLLEVIESLPETSVAEMDEQLEGMLDQLGRRARLLNSEARHGGVPGIYSESHLIEARRGSRESVLARSADLADRLLASQPVVDLAAGRGELLELLRIRGVSAVGAEADPILAQGLRQDGLDVSSNRPLDFLAAQPDGTLGGIFAGHVLDREGPQAAPRLARLAAQKLRQGGLLVIEDDNPEYLPRRGELVRPGLLRGLRPEELKFLLSENGFTAVEVEWRVPAAEQLQTLPDGIADPNSTRIWNGNLDLLNEILFAPREYAVIATR